MEIQIDGQQIAEYNSFLHVDYVRNALANKFSLRLTSKVDFEAYTTRILSMLWGYFALGVDRTTAATNPALNKLMDERRQWIVLSFKELSNGDPELTQATIDTNTTPAGPFFRATVFRATTDTGQPILYQMPANFQKRRIPITGRRELILAPTDRAVFLKKPEELKWRRGVVKFV